MLINTIIQSPVGADLSHPSPIDRPSVVFPYTPIPSRSCYNNNIIRFMMCRPTLTTLACFSQDS